MFFSPLDPVCKFLAVGVDLREPVLEKAADGQSGVLFPAPDGTDSLAKEGRDFSPAIQATVLFW